MINIIRSAERYHFVNDWLSTYWHFSFDRYYDPNNIAWGPLRVFNDDIVRPSSGFPMHSHREMEIITYVLEGELEHKDSTGGTGRIGPGEVQRMTAGTGIRHSEYNPSTDTPVHLLQIWITPATSSLPPSYEQKRFTREQRAGVLFAIASGQKTGDALTIHQDATIYVSSLKPGDQLAHQMNRDRRAYFFLINGDIGLNGSRRLTSGDQARIEKEAILNLVAFGPSELILLDLP